MKSTRLRLSRKSQTWRQPSNTLPLAITIGMPESSYGTSIPSARQSAPSSQTLPAEFGWSDLGSWSSLRTLLPQDEAGNAKVGKDIRLYECKNCMVHAADESKVVVQGLDGYIVAEKNGQLLVCSLKEELRIKEFGK